MMTNVLSPGRVAALAIALHFSTSFLSTASDRKTNDARDPVMDANSAQSAGKAYVELFGKGGPTGAARLKMSASPELAVFAAWESDLSLIPLKSRFPEYAAQLERFAKAGGYEPARWAISSQHLDRFVGFCEGRLRILVPDWWKEQLFRHHCKRDGLLRWFPDDDSRSGQKRREMASFELGRREISTVDGTHLRRATNRIVVEKGGLSASLAYRSFDKFAFQQCSSCFANDAVFLAFPRSVSYSFPLVCIDRNDGRIRWQTEVWALATQEYARGGTTGPAHSIATIVGNGKAVYVFGYDWAGIYIEGFDTAGNVIMRFASNYWYQDMKSRNPVVDSD